MPKRGGVESGAGGRSSHRGGAGHAGEGAQSGAGDSKKSPVGKKKSTSGPKKQVTKMVKQKSPHTQSEQNTRPERTDLEPGQSAPDLSVGDQAYERMEGDETGGTRSPRRIQSGAPRHNTEPEAVAHEGPIETRTPKRPAQGITSRSAREESERQQKVVKNRPEAQGGVKH